MPQPSVQERFGARVRDTRAARGLTLVQVSFRANLPIERLEEIEAGQYDPDLEEIDRLAKALDISLADLLDDLNEEPEGREPAQPAPAAGLSKLLSAVRSWLKRG